MTEVSDEQLLRWAAALTLADSHLSLLYHRAPSAFWGGLGMLDKEDVHRSFIKARQASEEASKILRTAGVDDHAIAREMDKPYWERVA